MALRELVVYGALGPAGTERPLAWRLLEAALGREYGLASLPEVAREPGGRPFFPSREDICFNISHSRGAAVCALHSLPVGVDVEQLRPAPRRLAGDMDDETFFRLWTAKEATVKRRGQGVAALAGELEPDPLCRCLEDFLPGWIDTVCPALDPPARTVRLPIVL